jgi:L-ascorbate metabolism protein UlaG (beta-lactamase superfamily)
VNDLLPENPVEKADETMLLNNGTMVLMQVWRSIYLFILKIFTMKKILIPACLLAVNLFFVTGCNKPGSESDHQKDIDKVVERIHWIEQSCFRIDAAPYTVYIDPNSVSGDIKADLILITHPHGDHWSPAELDKIVKPGTILIAPEEVVYTGNIAKRIVLKPGEEFNDFPQLKIKAVPAYNINKVWFHPREANWVGYLIKIKDVTIYHSGDTERIPEMKTFTADIALLPLGQTYTFDTVNDAAEAAKDVHAKLAIPMHFGLYEGTAADAVTFKTLLNGIIPVVIKVKGQ